MSGGFRPEEMEILQKELGNSAPYLQTSKRSNDLSESDLLNLSGDRGKSETDTLQNYNPMPTYSAGRLSDQPSSFDNGLAKNDDSGITGEKSDLELLPMDSTGLQESGDLIPMLRLDEPLNPLEKE